MHGFRPRLGAEVFPIEPQRAVCTDGGQRGGGQIAAEGFNYQGGRNCGQFGRDAFDRIALPMVRPNRSRRRGIAEQFGQRGGMVVPKGYLKTGFVQPACQPQGNADVAVVVDHAAK